MLFGVASTESSKYKIRSNGKKTLEYQIYENMVARCYYPKTARYESYGGCGVRICEEWLEFHNFAEWCEDNYIEGFFLDKDILSEDGMLYSPEDCCFLPRELNNLFVLGHRGINKEVNEGLPSGVFRHKNKFYGRYKNQKKYFDDMVSARNYVWSIKYEVCKKWVEFYKDKLNPDVADKLTNKDFFMITLNQMDRKREVKIIE